MSQGAQLVDVTFIDAESGQAFLQLKLPARQLPDSFAAATTLNLGKDDWTVVEARPPTAAEFVAAGKLVLTLRKLAAIDPRDLLFSLPTVADEVPKVVPAPDGAAPLARLHEDDWLQLELVPEEVAARAQADLDAVAGVLATARKGPGFERLHLRKALPAPFSERVLELSTLEARYGLARPVGLAGGIAEHGFAFALPGGAVLYGQRDGARVIGLGVDRADAPVEELRARERLVLLDWVAAARR